jgi:AcrR family transcriptional regulator
MASRSDRRAGVSHGAPTHHVGDKAGVLAAVAARDFQLLADAPAAAQRTGDFYEVGAAYARFAVDHRAHFEVMFRPELCHADDQAAETGPRAGSPPSMMRGGPR